MRQIFTHTAVFALCRQFTETWPRRGIWQTTENKDNLRHPESGYPIFYNPLEHLAVDEVIVKFQGRVIFRQYIPKKRKHFGIKIYKLCDESGYTYDMKVYLGRDSRSATDNRTATHATVTHATVTHLTSRVQGLGHQLFMDNFFSTPRLFDDFLRRKMHPCGTVRPNRKDMPSDFGPKKLKLTRAI